MQQQKMKQQKILKKIMIIEVKNIILIQKIFQKKKLVNQKITRKMTILKTM